MKTLLPFLCLLSICQGTLIAQGCLSQGTTFSSQAQIDSFPVNYPDCTTIQGVVFVQGNDITNLDGLASLHILKSSLYIQLNPLLTNISGLSNLTAIGAGGSVRSLYITNNPLLVHLEGLNNLSEIQGYLDISDNAALENINALSNISSVGKTFYITSNPKLKNLTGLKNLRQVGQDLIVEEVPLLSSMAGLDSLVMIGGSLQIQFNEHLKSLSGLSPDLHIMDEFLLGINPLLTFCSIQSVCNFIEMTPEHFAMCGNAAGCESPAEITAQCQSTGTKEIVGFDKIRFYPNPCQDVLHIDTEMPTQISIFDIWGQLKWADIIDSDRQIETGQLPDGRYFLKQMINGKSLVASFVKISAP